MFGRLLVRGHCQCSQLFKRDYRVLFMGTDDFAVSTLQKLKFSRTSRPELISCLEVVCPPDRPKGKRRQITPGPVSQYCLDHNIAVHELPKEVDFRLNDWELPKPKDGSGEPWDLGIIVSFGYHIPQRVITSFSEGMMNLHPSLLPRYRGSSPIQTALINGDVETGVSVITLSTVMDSGAILGQETKAIAVDSTYKTLYPELAEQGAELVLKCVEEYPSRVQDARLQGKCSLGARKILKSRGQVELNSMTAKQVVDLWRGLHGFVPVSIPFRNKKIILVELDLANSLQSLVPPLELGEVVYDTDYQVLLIQAKGGVIAVKRLQKEGKTAVDAKSFAQSFIDVSKKGPKGRVLLPKAVFG